MCQVYGIFLQVFYKQIFLVNSALKKSWKGTNMTPTENVLNSISDNILNIVFTDYPLLCAISCTNDYTYEEYPRLG